jgi:hypothetical protein
MMRLSPRLICFIGASGLLLQSTLAAQEEKMSDAQYKTIWEPQILGGTKVGEVMLDQKSLHIIFKCGKDQLCNIYEVSHCDRSKTVTIKGTQCEYLPEEDNPVIFRQFDKVIVLKKVELQDDLQIELFKNFRNALLSACRVDVGKFKACGKKGDLSFHSQLLASKQNYQLTNFKPTIIMICRNEEGNYVFMWCIQKKSCKLQLVDEFKLRSWHKVKDRALKHQATQLEGFTTDYTYPLEYIIQGTQCSLSLQKKGNNKLKQVKKGKRFMHFFVKASQTGEFGRRIHEKASEKKEVKKEKMKEMDPFCDFRDYFLEVCTRGGIKIVYKEVKQVGNFVNEQVPTEQFMTEKKKGNRPPVFSPIPMEAAKEKKKVNPLSEAAIKNGKKTLKKPEQCAPKKVPHTDELLAKARERANKDVIIELEPKEKKQFGSDICDDLKAELDKRRKKIERLDQAERL